MFQKICNFNGIPRLNYSEQDEKLYAVTVDQFDAQEFNLNDAGWIRNTISELSRATSKSEYDAIMARLVELKNVGGIPEGTSIHDAISMIKPRWCQSPNEIENWIQSTNPVVMAKIDAAYQLAVRDDVEDDAKQPASVDSPSPSPDVES